MNYDNKKGDMVPVDAPENKEGHHEKDGDHKMIMHQLTNLKQNAEELLDHLSHCSTNHMKEGWVKKKITLATDYLDSARDYIISGHETEHGEEHGGGGNKKEMGGDFLVMVERRMAE